jgi:hypothetical protein
MNQQVDEVRICGSLLKARMRVTSAIFPATPEVQSLRVGVV